MNDMRCFVALQQIGCNAVVDTCRTTQKILKNQKVFQSSIYFWKPNISGRVEMTTVGNAFFRRSLQKLIK